MRLVHRNKITRRHVSPYLTLCGLTLELTIVWGRVF